MSSKSYKAFVSSTYEDLKEHRAHVIWQLQRAGIFVDPMEMWTADTDEPKQFSQDRMEGCDLCVLLVAFRRGFVPEGETRSITQLEYDAAVSRGIDILPFLLKEQTPWLAEFDDRRDDEDLLSWRADLQKNHGVEWFTLDPHSIDLMGAVTRWLAKKQDNGSVTKEGDPTVEWPDGTSPYPGLEWFDEEYAPLYFGRDREVAEVLAKMSRPECRFLIISGTSGSGKSSLVGAGLWRVVMKDGRLSENHEWGWQRMVPGDGSTPFESLAWALKSAFPRRNLKPSDLSTQLTKGADAISQQLATCLDDNQALVLFVDQLEELFTRSFNEDDIRCFLTHLVATARNPENRLRVISTVRSEFLGKLEEHEAVLDLLNAGFMYHLPPISRNILQEMIEKPAKVTGYEFEPNLVDTMLEEAGNEPGRLPLVAYTLKQLFEQRQGRTFTHEAYQAMGGIVGAIGTKADAVLETLNGEVQSSFDRIFAELVHLERERPPTRIRVALSVFQHDANVTQLIDKLAGQDCRVLVITHENQHEPRDSTGIQQKTATVEVAHEKLFSAWPKLKEWIEDSGEALRLIDHAEETAERWHDGGEHLRELWTVRQTQEVQQAFERFGKSPSPQLDRMLRPQQILIARLDDAALSHEERLLIGQKLDEFGDPRPGVGVGPDGLPDIVWIDIPAGHIQLEGIDQVFEVTPYRLAQYPVTKAQFQAFLDDGGYQNEMWWEGLQKVDPSPSSWKEGNAPRETLSWFDAVAFCRWLSERTGTAIRLPTEWEWQQAATGGDPTYAYPWGREWDPARCNGFESRVNRTTPVGIYPRGATKHGLMDMAGNVWEWCLNTYENPVEPESVKIDNEANASRVIRGGSWSYLPDLLRASYRNGGATDFRFDNLGFRLVQGTP